MRYPILLYCAFVLYCALTAAPSIHAQQTPPKCDAPEHRQFDFWIGAWEVADSVGRVLGHSIITARQEGCVLHEQWTGAGGMTGESFNIFDRATRRWHQSWVSATGTLLLLNGELEDGSMVLHGETPGSDGRVQRQRITWTPRTDGSVIQHWETSADGREWQTVFRGFYRRAP